MGGKWGTNLFNMWNNFHARIYPSKILCFRAGGLCVNSTSSPGCQNTSSYFQSHWRHRHGRVTTALPAASSLGLDSLRFCFPIHYPLNLKKLRSLQMLLTIKGQCKKWEITVHPIYPSGVVKRCLFIYVQAIQVDYQCAKCQSSS
jgi:hypothetical protein